MSNQAAATILMPESGQQWKCVEEFDFLNTSIPFTVLDVTDNVVYFTPDKIHFKDGAFYNEITIHNAYGTTCFSMEPFTYRKGIPSKILYKPLNFRKLRLDLFLNEFQRAPDVVNVVDSHKPSGFLSSWFSKLKSKISAI
jgi:hypothetical protein